MLKDKSCEKVGNTWLTTILKCQTRVNAKKQADSRMGRRRALQILAGREESPRSNPSSYSTHFRCKMDPEKKKNFNPWAIEKELHPRN